jgi:hypothetical protein
MTKYVTFTVKEKYADTLVPILNNLTDGRKRSKWICSALVYALEMGGTGDHK